MIDKKHLLIYKKRIEYLKKRMQELINFSADYGDKKAIATLIYELKMRQVGYFQMEKYAMIIRWLWDNGYTLHSLNLEKVKEIILNILSSDLADETKTSRISTFKSMLKILNDYQIINIDFSKIKFRYNNQLKPVEEMDIPTKEEVEAMIDYASSLKMKTIIAVLSDAGLRIGELLSLQRKNIKVEDYKITLLVEGKTGFRRVALFKPSNGFTYLLKYLKYNKLMDIEPERYIFRKRGKDNVPVRYNSIRKSFALTLKKMKEDEVLPKNKRISLHTLRHFAVSEYAKAGVPDMVLKKQFGWSKSSKMLARYTTISAEIVEEFARKVQQKRNEN